MDRIVKPVLYLLQREFIQSHIFRRFCLDLSVDDWRITSNLLVATAFIRRKSIALVATDWKREDPIIRMYKLKFLERRNEDFVAVGDGHQRRVLDGGHDGK